MPISLGVKETVEVMENFRGMAIGIDNYLDWPPLQDGESNAQALYQYLNCDAKIPSEQLVLLTDTSPQVGLHPTYPNQANIQQWVKDWPNQVKLGWFFFQGYGASDQGKDYLIPIDGHPQTMTQSALEMRSLLKLLQGKTQRLLVILNLRVENHDQGLQERAIALAQTMGIALVFAPQENNARMSLFTLALLEALRYYGHHLTLGNLDAYLRERLTFRVGTPNRSIPVIISPSLAAQDLPLLPQPLIDGKTVSQPVNRPVSRGSTLILPILPQPSPAPVVSSASPSSPQKTVSGNYQQGFFWGGMLFFVLGLLSFFLVHFERSNSTQRSLKEEFSEAMIQGNQQILNYAKTLISANQASRFNQAIEVARQIPPQAPLYQEAQDHITRWSLGIWEIAEGRAIQGDFQGAIAAARLVPQDRPQIYQTAQQSIIHWQKLTAMTQ